jgi:hypothetical protein
MSYAIALIILLILYVLVVFRMKYMKNVKLWNFIFGSVVFVLYVVCLVRIYLSVGFYDWNFQNALPLANLSPFSFSIVPLALILPKPIKQYFYLLICLLSVGMILSSTFNCIFNAIRGYSFHVHFILDYVSHLALSLWGVYLIKSGCVKLNKKDCLISFAVLMSVITLILILNVIFDTAFFGLSLNGKHNIIA